MRTRLIEQSLFVLVLINCSGCCIWPFCREQPIDAPIVFTATPTAAQVVDQINANSNRVYQLESQVRVSIEGLPTITGDLALEKPNRFRLVANLLGVSGMGADVGSNDELFWVWLKSPLPAHEPAIYFARHHEYAVSPARQQLPIDPSWIRDALGLTEIDPATVLGPLKTRPDGTYEIQSQIDTPTGPMTRITIVDPSYGWIVEQAIFDRFGTLILVAKSSEHRHNQQTGVSLPHHIEIEIQPGTREAATIVIDSTSFTINRITSDPARLWSMPNPQGVPIYDLASPAAMPGQVNPAFNASSTTLGQHRTPYDRPISQQAQTPNYRGRQLR